jgi:hypothetical protein
MILPFRRLTRRLSGQLFHGCEERAFDDGNLEEALSRLEANLDGHWCCGSLPQGDGGRISSRGYNSLSCIMDRYKHKERAW